MEHSKMFESRKEELVKEQESSQLSQNVSPELPKKFTIKKVKVEPKRQMTDYLDPKIRADFIMESILY